LDSKDVVTIREYFEIQFDELDKRVSQHFNLNDKAIEKAERAIDERLGKMNEMRGALEDLGRKMASRESLDSLERVVNEIRREKANLDGRLLIIVIGANLILNWFISHFLTK